MKTLPGLTFAACLIGLAACSTMNAGSAALDGKTLFANNCAGCHGPEGFGGRAPVLKGQSAADLTRKLDGYRAGTYGGAKKQVMAGVVQKRSSQELNAVAQYLGAL